jgi:hypothetical protein
MTSRTKNLRVEELKDAVWQTWLRGVESGMGSGTPTEMVKEYGFTGHFAGLDAHYKDPMEFVIGLENALGRF